MDRKTYTAKLAGLQRLSPLLGAGQEGCPAAAVLVLCRPASERHSRPNQVKEPAVPHTFSVSRHGGMTRMSVRAPNGTTEIGHLDWDPSAVAISLYIAPAHRRRGLGAELWRRAAAHVADTMDSATLTPSYARTVLGELFFLRLQVDRPAWSYLSLPMTDARAVSNADPALLVPDDPEAVDRMLTAAGFDPAAAVWAGAGTLDAALPLHDRHPARRWRAFSAIGC